MLKEEDEDEETMTTKKSNRQFLYESMQRRPARTYLEKGRKHQASCAPSF